MIHDLILLQIAISYYYIIISYFPSNIVCVFLFSHSIKRCAWTEEVYVCWLINNQIGNVPIIDKVPNSNADAPNTIKTKRNQTFDIALKQEDRK